MQGNLIMITAITFLHDLFTAVWIGGMIATGFAVLPAAKKQLGMGPQTRQFMQAFQRKLKVLVYISIVGLVVTGVLMSLRSSQFQGLLTWSNPYSVILALKHLLVILMIVIALVRSLVFGRVKVPAAGQPEAGTKNPIQGAKSPKQGAKSPEDKASVVLLLMNIVLGIGVLVLSAAAAALATQGGQLSV